MIWLDFASVQQDCLLNGLLQVWASSMSLKTGSARDFSIEVFGLVRPVSHVSAKEFLNLKHRFRLLKHLTNRNNSRPNLT